LFIFLTDGFDGYFARKYDKPDQMGSFLDIASDRVAETTLLVPFVYYGIAHPFILIFFIAKGFTVDYFRVKKFANTGKVPFAQGNSIMFLVVKSRLVRVSYAILKMVLIIIFYCKLTEIVLFPEYLYSTMTFIVILLATLRSVPAIVDL
jgi:CDP-diacylglycerol--glycerol-3-phosphate 3-phosphatidyltransferase